MVDPIAAATPHVFDDPNVSTAISVTTIRDKKAWRIPIRAGGFKGEL